ncbi:hypothetical protein BH09ACT6_BH09ACT6_08650 [soil metagenome]
MNDAPRGSGGTGDQARSGREVDAQTGARIDAGTKAGEGPGAAGRGVFDPGLQVERTALSWQRTGLAIVVGSLVGIRVLVPVAGWWGVGIGAAGALLGVFVVLRSSIRHREIHERLTGDERAPLPGAGVMAVVAAAAVLAAVVALAFVIVTAIALVTKVTTG